MLYRATRDFTSSVHGNVSAGDLVEVSSGLAPQWLDVGMIEALPGKTQGSAAEHSSASQAGQALPNGKQNTYETKPQPLSPATRLTKPSRDVPSSTGATRTGGNDTQKPSRKPVTKAGRKTRKPQQNTE